MNFEKQGRALNRRDSLSIGRSVGKWSRLAKKRKKPSNQLQSLLFLRLPLEIRTEIYKLAFFSTGAVHIRLALSQSPHGVPDRFESILALGCNAQPEGLPGFNAITTQTHTGLLIRKAHLSIALLQTCRLIYTEALPVLYGQTQFVFEGIRDMVAFSNSVPRSHMHKISSIRLEHIVHTRPRYAYRILPNLPLHRPLERNPLPIDRLHLVLSPRKQLRSVYLVIKIASHIQDEVVSDRERSMLDEYINRAAELVSERCRVHLVVFNWSEIYHQETKHGKVGISR